MKETCWENAEWETEPEVHCWELFHENAKTGRYDKALTNEQVLKQMENMYESFPYKLKKRIQLPDSLSPTDRTFEEIILSRKTVQEPEPVKISLRDLRTILHFAYGETRDNKEDEYIKRPFRTVPSGGALYPLELYFFSNGHVEDLEAGLYHYSPSKNSVCLLRTGDFSDQISSALVEFQSNLAYQLSLFIFITGVFQRSTFKYRDKGYRFTLFEAGHVAQNINLAATALNLGVINIGGYHDREMDQFLGFDGLRQSTIYINGIGSGNQ
ncbi:MAG: SagB/ThcOx family dehydrogenase [Balneolaceae bacterium]|nr:SagB/ThcOx family dehydrogenase [Balneolaceae bacterium]